MRIRTILTDNAKEFTDRLFGLRKRAPTGEHEFDKLCADLDIDHRLTPPKSPQTNGMVERFNGRIEEVLQSHHFRSGEELEATLHRYVWLYNQQLPQSALGSRSPLQAMKDWYTIKPKLFKKTGNTTFRDVTGAQSVVVIVVVGAEHLAQAAKTRDMFGKDAGDDQKRDGDQHTDETPYPAPERNGEDDCDRIDTQPVADKGGGEELAFKRGAGEIDCRGQQGGGGGRHGNQRDHTNDADADNSAQKRHEIQYRRNNAP